MVIFHTSSVLIYLRIQHKGSLYFYCNVYFFAKKLIICFCMHENIIIVFVNVLQKLISNINMLYTQKHRIIKNY